MKDFLSSLFIGMGLAFVGIGILILVALIFCLPVMWLWNWLMPTIFGLTEITFMQAMGITFLSNLLFGNNNFNSKS